jgi:hypothetical protein
MTEFATATLTATTDIRGRKIPAKQQGQRRLKVHFNPEKLELTMTNAMEQNRNRRRREPPQLVTETTAKLSLELLFDTTDTGSDVRAQTFQIAQLMQPRPGPRQEGEQRGVPAIVLFEWGSFVFEGYIDSYKETLDFFAPEGVPLRATLSLSLTEQAKPFQGSRAKPPVDDREIVPTAPDRSIDGFRDDLGVSREAAQAIARDNGIENPRFPGVDQVAVPSSSPPRPPQPLATPPPAPSPSARPGIGAAAEAGAFAGARAGAANGSGFAAEAGAFAGVRAGATNGSGFAAEAGAFAGMRAGSARGNGASALAAFNQLRTPPEISFETPRFDFDGSLGAGVTAALDLRTGIGVGGSASAGVGAGVSAGAAGGLGAGGGIVADVGASVDAAIIIEEP